jgi:hypothetical protein
MRFDVDESEVVTLVKLKMESTGQSRWRKLNSFDGYVKKNECRKLHVLFE